MNHRFVSTPCQVQILASVLFIPPETPSAQFPCLILCHGAFEYKENFYEMADGLRQTGIATDKTVGIPRPLIEHVSFLLNLHKGALK